MLSLLQGRREWSGAEPAERLGVTDRTVRRDVERLRDLGYPVDATTGTAGGYRLASGRDLPPLLLDDEETCTVRLGADAPARLLADLVALDAPFTLDADEDVRAVVREAARRLSASLD